MRTQCPKDTFKTLIDSLQFTVLSTFMFERRVELSALAMSRREAGSQDVSKRQQLGDGRLAGSPLIIHLL